LTVMRAQTTNFYLIQNLSTLFYGNRILYGNKIHIYKLQEVSV